MTDTEYQASRDKDRGRCVGGDSYDQKMIWEEIVKNRDQLALVESAFNSRNCRSRSPQFISIWLEIQKVMTRHVATFETGLEDYRIGEFHFNSVPSVR